MILAWGSKLTPAERVALVDVCADVQIPDPSMLSACVMFESGWSPGAINITSGASGIIQFMPSTAIRLGTTVERIRQMSIGEQLELVRKYFAPFRGRIQSITDCYMAILWPAAIGKPDDAPLFSTSDNDTRAYMWNRGLDVDKNGTVTKAEATARVAALYETGLQPPNAVEIDVGAPIDRPGTRTPTAPPPEQPMPLLALLSTFGPILAQLIPQIGTLVGGQRDQKNLTAIGTVLDTVVKAAGQVGPATMATVGAAVDAMQANPDVQKAVTAAVVTHPQIMPYLQIGEIGGGVVAARDADAKLQTSEKPFYKSSAVFWVSMALLPMVYWLVGSLIVGGVDIPADWPAWLQIPLKLFGGVWNGESRSGGFNLVIGLVLGGICGVYYGVSVTQARQTAQTASAAQPPSST